MFWRRRERLDEEVQNHLAEETADNLARGMDPATARAAALRTFGNVGVAKERARELDPLYWLDTLWQDVRFALRVMARNPWTSITIVLTLTLTITLNVGVFSLLNVVCLRPWVRAEPETFVGIFPRFQGSYGVRHSEGLATSQPDYEWYRDAAKSLSSLAAYQFQGITLGGEDSGTVRGALVSCNLFDMMRLGRPVLGRYLTAEECARPGEPAVAVLNETAWRTRFHADPAIVGQVIQLNRVPFTVVGVSPAMPITGAPQGADLWLPYTMLPALRPANGYFLDPRAQWLTLVGRRRPDASLKQVQLELNALAQRADERVPGRTTSLTVTDGSLAQHPEVGFKVPLVFFLTLGTTTLLLVLACVNVTTLLLSRAAARQREIAVRLSIGAGRFRLVRQLLTETLVLSALATAFSIMLAQPAISAFWNRMAPGSPLDVAPDWHVLLYCLAVSTVAGAIAGLSPALESLRPDLVESLKGSGTGATQGKRGSHFRSALVAVQISLSLVLLAQAGLYLRAQRQFLSYEPGFETKQVLSLMLTSVATGFEPPPAFYRDLEARVRAAPGVSEVSFASIGMWSGRNSTELADIDGRPIPQTKDYNRDPARRLVAPGFFGALGIALTRGRAFTRNEASSAVISEAMARRYWPGEDPVGHSFRVGATRHQIVGVCRDVQSVRFMTDDGPFYYLPLAPQTKAPFLLVRVAGDPQSIIPQIRETVRQLDPQMAASIVTLSSILAAQAENLKPVMILGSIAGGLALLLALTGVYGVVSYSVSQRIREIGLRMALGAQRADVLALVLRSGAMPVMGGLAVGTLLAFGLSRMLESILFGLSARHAFGTLAVVPVLLFVTAAGAIWIPARRAAALDPLHSLRHE
jgi:predicted permease